MESTSAGCIIHRKVRKADLSGSECGGWGIESANCANFIADFIDNASRVEVLVANVVCLLRRQ